MFSFLIDMIESRIGLLLKKEIQKPFPTTKEREILSVPEIPFGTVKIERLPSGEFLIRTGYENPHSALLLSQDEMISLSSQLREGFFNVTKNRTI